MAKVNSNHGARTKAVHAGDTPDPVTRASSPAIQMSSTFVLDELAGFSAHDLNVAEEKYLYARWGNPTAAQLETKLAAMEGGEAALALASGMAASAAVLLSVLSAGDHLVISDTNYAGTAELARETLPRFGIEVTPVDTSDPDNIADAMRTTTKLVWIETPANPIMRLTDIAAAAQIAHDAGARLAVDSTFATPIATQPLALGADYVVHSLTKYFCGHGDALGGAVIGSQELISELRAEAAIHHGGVISPFNAWLIMRGAGTLPVRMAAHAESAQAIAEWLEQHPKVTRINYPGLASHPQHDLAKRQMANFSGMLSFCVDDHERVRRKATTDLAVIHHAVSLGHHRSLICWIGTDDMMETTFQHTGDRLESYRALARDGVFRLSVGLEDPADIVADLDGLLS
ncbi:MAG: PLP-dependent aspartate aminotransferase family protein [Pseudomonadota bacterium]